MNGIYIRGMEMPVIELEWTIRYGADGKWYAIDTNAETTDGEWHEIVPVPPHGDLIERKAVGLTDFEIVMCDGDYKEGMKMLLEKIESAPTIIQASEEEMK